MKKSIKEIYDALNNENLIKQSSNLKYDKMIYGVCYNSKKECENRAFICKGFNFNQLYLKEAIEKGASIYISERVHSEQYPYIIVKDSRKALAVISKLFYIDKIKGLKMVGITGTKGKSTTSFMVKNVIDTYLQSENKSQCGIISSIKTFDGCITKDAMLTTPESLEAYSMLGKAVENGVEYFVCEVSSIAYKYYRVYGLNFNVGVFLNIAPDHISDIEHKDFNDYFLSKIKLIHNCEYLVINEELLRYDEIKDALKNKEEEKVIVFGKGEGARCKLVSYNSNSLGSSFKISFDEKMYDFNIKLKGKYNIENALACISVCKILGIDYKFIYKGMLNLKVKGRGEIYKTKDNKKVIVVDYAHNGLSLTKYFEFVHEEYPNRKHICVIGSVGGKAINRRKDIGNICYVNCDEIILTTDDSLNEDFENICADILRYMPDRSKVKLIEDRTMAIKEALDDSRDEEVVVSVLGKGGENTQKVKGKSVFYISDSENARNYIEKYNEDIK